MFLSSILNGKFTYFHSHMAISLQRIALNLFIFGELSIFVFKICKLYEKTRFFTQHCFCAFFMR